MCVHYYYLTTNVMVPCMYSTRFTQQRDGNSLRRFDGSSSSSPAIAPCILGHVLFETQENMLRTSYGDTASFISSFSKYWYECCHFGKLKPDLLINSWKFFSFFFSKSHRILFYSILIIRQVEIFITTIKNYRRINLHKRVKIWYC